MRSVVALGMLVFAVGCAGGGDPGPTGPQGAAGPAGPQGATGSPGAAGSDGYTTLLATAALPIGDGACPAGGFRVEVGLDVDRSGTLEPAEYIPALTRNVCNGDPNQPVSSLTLTTELDTSWPGTHVLGVQNADGLELLRMSSSADFQVRGSLDHESDTLYFQGRTGAFRMGRFVTGLGAGLLPANSIALGALGDASAERAFSVNGWASGVGAVAIGNGAEATSENALALGPSSVAGGVGSTAIGPCVANGHFGTCIGMQNKASGANSVAIGKNADTANRSGAIVISDASGLFSSDTLQATANNQFSVRAVGGHRLFTNPDATVGCSLAPGGASWGCTSDRNAKEDFQEIDSEAVLAKVVQLPIQSWKFKTEQGARHVGPTAQDFRAAFGLGSNDTTIETVDADGVNMLAIQALARRTEEVAALRDEVAELRARLDALAEQLAIPVR